MATSNQPPIALTIAGSDSGGGAGIQADLKTFHAHHVHGLSVIAAITSQNTRGVTAVHPVPLAHIRNQIQAVFDDFPIAAVKTGMLGNAKTVRLVARELRRRKPAWLVVDPVMISTSGSRLLDEDAVEAVINELIPLADIVTPNLPEAESLLGRPLRTARQLEAAGEALLALGAASVLLKGGHARGDKVVDRYFDDRGVIEIRHTRLPREGHGTGCTLASAIAAELALGHTPRQAIRRASAYVHRALKDGYRPGGGAVYVLRH
ncbi:bifunctional hydroxymethylpyrimidine kinase/phosphomethylpyrimidine kinase [Dyella caseinilytica]|uniref:hydroxymethylpyrimidine kinase n=1 Tax=Dyella caseinilytica TaxID=1849581 RepID=A0ABX7GX90_9GAMM|nr:bifunctional hydroxymethylpyrimidine kinase/phosphomethylpyrimidine kinase [Dyella caseinilytica]QRN54930.1 bifunctional hydroxymethylpyrimidine kinase/phosphomethylpyrimidine kinase [Dyella caseinilytica]GFZ98019.1 hydroxymethylpyrimidine/phosphomethylpyrimidine kinase [Dyella caseinilytica]